MESKDQVLRKIRDHGENVYLTIGFRWKNPTTMDKEMSVSQAIRFVQEYDYLYETQDRDGKFCLNAYTASDMW